MVKDRVTNNNQKYGVDYPQQLEEIKDKIKATNLERYGVPNYSQSNEFWDKFKRSIKWKEYNGQKYQTSYELDFLIHCESKNIELSSNIPRIEYIHNDEMHYYFPDFYIESMNLLIEIKSYYWWKKLEEKNVSKVDSVKSKGYNFILIMDKNYEEFNKLIHHIS